MHIADQFLSSHSTQVVHQNSHEASLAGRRQKTLDSLQRYTVNKINREEKELQLNLDRLQHEKDILQQMDALQGGEIS